MHTYKRQIFLVYVNGGIFDREFGAFFSTWDSRNVFFFKKILAMVEMVRLDDENGMSLQSYGIKAL